MSDISKDSSRCVDVITSGIEESKCDLRDHVDLVIGELIEKDIKLLETRLRERIEAVANTNVNTCVDVIKSCIGECINNIKRKNFMDPDCLGNTIF